VVVPFRGGLSADPSVVISVMAARVAFSSTMAFAGGVVAVRAWRRLKRHRGDDRGMGQPIVCAGAGDDPVAMVMRRRRTMRAAMKAAQPAMV
jgi:hypothetical protein